MEGPITGRLAEFNRLYKQLDALYHAYAKRQGIADMALWLLYSLYESGGGQTQRALCADWHVPPQTVNSALKTLERQALVALEAAPGSRKNKLVVLTPAGEAYVRAHIAPLVDAETRAFAAMPPEQSAQMLALTRQYIAALEAALDQAP